MHIRGQNIVLYLFARSQGFESLIGLMVVIYSNETILALKEFIYNIY